MSVFERQLKLRSSDVDMDRRLRTSVLFSMIQEAAIAHTEELGMGREKTLDKGLLWIVTLQFAQVDRMPCYDEEVILRSWPGDTMHLLFPRYFALDSASGEKLLRCSALWSLLDSRTRGIVFPEKHGIVIRGEKTGDEIALPSAPRSLPFSGEKSFTVPYSFVDLNGHMNNTRYFDLAEDCIHDQVRGKELKSIKTEFAKEVLLGDELTLSFGREEDRFFICGSKDRPCFKIGLEYK